MAEPLRRGATSTAFVGRTRELQIVDGLLDATVQGTGRVLSVSGEAGIGKTRLLDEIVLRARRRGMLVLRGRCEADAAGTAYGAFRTALDGYVAEVSAATLRGQLGLHTGVIAPLVPRVRERLADVAEAVRLQPDEERTRLFDAVSQFLISIAARAPLVLALDDLHWADNDTLALLRHLGRTLASHRVLVLGAYRGEEVEEGGALAQAIAVMRRQAGFERLALSGLASAEIEALLQNLAEQRSSAWSAGPVDAALRTAIGDETKGNPFFVRSLVSHLEEEGRLRVEEGCWRASTPIENVALPDGVRQVLRRRINRLTPETQTFLTVAAAVGGTFRFDIVVTAGDLSDEQGLVAVDAALHAQLIESAPVLDSYAFVHALVRQALYEVLNPSRRVRLHRQIAEVMEQAYGDHATEYAGDIAEHYYRSATLPGAERGVTFALLGADQAERSTAFAMAATYLRMALDLATKRDSRRPRLLAQLSRNLALTQEGERALAVVREAAPLIEQTEGQGATAEYLAGLLEPLFEGGLFPTAFEVARMGLTYVGNRRDMAWASFAAIAIIEQEFADDQHPGIAIDNLERQQIRELFAPFAPALPSYARTFIRRDQIPAAVDVVGEVYRSGEYRTSLPQLYEWAAKAASQGLIGVELETWATIVRCQIALGDFALARETLARSKRLEERMAGWIRRVATVAAEDELRAALDEGWNEFRVVRGTVETPAIQLPWHRASMKAAIARTQARMGRVDSALRLLAAVIPAIQRASGWTENYTRIVYDAAETLWLTRHTDYIATIEQNLRDKVVGPGYRYPMTDARLALGRLCASQGRCDEATEWFAKARVVLDEQGARPLRAITDYDEALMCHRRGADGDAERARPLLDAALAQFRAIGMPGWIRRAEHLRATGTEWSAAALAAPAAQPDATPVVEPAREAIAAAPAPVRSLFHLEGDFWAITYGAKTFRLKHARGLTFLAALLREPGREIAATDLASRSEGNGGGTAALGNDAATRRSLGDAGEMLDAPARASYRARVAELREELAEAERFNDRGRAEHLRDELEALSVELARAVGLGGRERRAGSHAERARVNVTRAIALVLAKIDDSDPALGEHLRRTIRTGALCCYAPDPRLPIEWEA